MDKKDFIDGINKLEMAYNQKFTKEKLQLWWDNLKSMPVDKYLSKIDELLQVNKFMPNIAEILDKRKLLGDYEQRDYSNYDFSQLYANKGAGQ